VFVRSRTEFRKQSRKPQNFFDLDLKLKKCAAWARSLFYASESRIHIKGKPDADPATGELIEFRHI
jgi:hypothetical protein